MKVHMRDAASTLEQLLAADHLTAGMSIRARGDHLILGRTADDGDNDRVRLTHLHRSTWGLSVKRHTGRWERTPFAGTIDELVGVMRTFMQHLVAS